MSHSARLFISLFTGLALIALLLTLADLAKLTPQAHARPAWQIQGCQARPIAFHVSILAGLQPGDPTGNVRYGTGEGDFGWLRWTDDSALPMNPNSEEYLAAALLDPSLAAINFLSSETSVGVGNQAPDFELATLSGDVIRLSQFRGQPTVISFGATWCPDCRKEASSLQRLHEDYPELKVLLVDSKEDSGTVQAFADEFGLTCTIALDDDGKVSKSYRIYAIPSVFFLDGQGVIQARFIGAPTQAQVEESLIAIGMTP